MEAPLLETDRLRLRAYQAADLAPLLAMWQQPEFYRYITGQPLLKSDVWARLLRDAGLWAVCGYGYWAIEAKHTGQFVGAVGFANFQRGLAATLDGYPEVGWSLAPAAQGQGYATEALGAALAWGDAHLPPRTVCIIHVDNQPSLRLAEKVGYREFDRADFKGQSVALLERMLPL